MQVEVNVLSMHTNFDGCRHSGFGDIATFKNGQISLSDHGLNVYIVYGHQKKFNVTLYHLIAITSTLMSTNLCNN